MDCKVAWNPLALSNTRALNMADFLEVNYLKSMTYRVYHEKALIDSRTGIALC
jgi:hypothetical protein